MIDCRESPKPPRRVPARSAHRLESGLVRLARRGAQVPYLNAAYLSEAF